MENQIAKHTPGPWHIADDGLTIGTGHTADICKMNALRIARKEHCIANDNYKADSYLIAAAPESLEYHKKSLKVLTRLISSGINDSALLGDLCSIAEWNEDAINKSEEGK